MTWAFRALFSLLRRSLSYSFLNRQFPYMIFIYLQLLIFISVLHTRTSAAKFEINFFAFINRTQKAIIHSTQVRAVKFGTHPKICVATFYTGFRVDANSYITSYVTRKWSIESCSLQEPDMILGKNIHFDYLQLTAELIRRYCLPHWKLHTLKFLQKRRKELWMEHFGEVKNNPTYCAKRSKHADGKVWNFLLVSLHFS